MAQGQDLNTAEVVDWTRAHGEWVHECGVHCGNLLQWHWGGGAYNSPTNNKMNDVLRSSTLQYFFCVVVVVVDAVLLLFVPIYLTNISHFCGTGIINQATAQHMFEVI